MADCIRGSEGGDEGNGPDNQNSHVAGAIGRFASVNPGMIPVWGPAVACKHEWSQGWVVCLWTVSHRKTSYAVHHCHFRFYSPGHVTSLTFLWISFWITCKDIETLYQRGKKCTHPVVKIDTPCINYTENTKGKLWRISDHRHDLHHHHQFAFSYTRLLMINDTHLCEGIDHINDFSQ